MSRNIETFGPGGALGSATVRGLFVMVRTRAMGPDGNWVVENDLVSDDEYRRGVWEGAYDRSMLVAEIESPVNISTSIWGRVAVEDGVSVRVMPERETREFVSVSDADAVRRTRAYQQVVEHFSDPLWEQRPDAFHGMILLAGASDAEHLSELEFSVGEPCSDDDFQNVNALVHVDSHGDAHVYTFGYFSEIRPTWSVADVDGDGSLEVITDTMLYSLRDGEVVSVIDATLRMDSCGC